MLENMESPVRAWPLLLTVTPSRGWQDGVIRIWDLPSLRQRSVLHGFTHEIHALAFSKEGSLLVGSAFDGTVRVWNLKPGKAPEPLPIECGKVIAFAISPTSPLLATSHDEGTSSELRFWDLTTGQEKLRLPGCGLGNNVLAFSPDGELLACGDKDSSPPDGENASVLFLNTQPGTRSFSCPVLRSHNRS